MHRLFWQSQISRVRIWFKTCDKVAFDLPIDFAEVNWLSLLLKVGSHNKKGFDLLQHGSGTITV